MATPAPAGCPLLPIVVSKCRSLQAFGSCIAGCALASSDVDLNSQVNLKGAKRITVHVLNETASLVSTPNPNKHRPSVLS